jgi:L-amino acid N-acyltransferase YncA
MAPAIRSGTPEDAAAIQAIYAHHVLHGTATFEEVPPDQPEIARRQAEIAGRGLPYLVAEAGGRVLGYAYAGPYRARSAYRVTIEDSIYLAPDAAGRGLGRRLLERLIAECTAVGARQLVAVIGDSGNVASIALHERLGFAHAGTLRSVGFKFGRWLDTVQMQLPLGLGDATLPAKDPAPAAGQN